MALWRIFMLILREQRTALTRGALLACVALIMGVALLGLSGWFITAAAAAGLAGMGAVFDVFRPASMVRLLALGRAAARYGERLLTHDATLRALEVLRVKLLRGLLAVPHDRMIRIRGAQALNRLTADIDALDGVALRLVLPFLAAVLTQLLVFPVLWWLVDLTVALWVLLGYAVGAGVLYWRSLRRTAPLSRMAEAGAQAFRTRMIDLIRGRADLAVQGQLMAQRVAVQAADDRRLALRRRLDAAERMAGAGSQMLGSIVAAGALWLGIALVQAGTVAPALAALGFFAALALVETIAPLRRATADLGRMAEAARRVSRDVAVPEDGPQGQGAQADPLQISAVTLHRPQSATPIISNLSLTLAAGETLALTGPSGSGKSTLLLAVAALHPVAAGQITWRGLSVDAWDEQALRGDITLLPQRSAVMAGTVADALRLAAPDADDATLWDVLAAVQLAPTLRKRDGIETRLGARGDGLSGGELRRLTLARALLRRPQVLLLDEPTEGLDEATARAVLRGLRQFLPRATILMAAHRSAETDFADRIVPLS